MYLLSSHGTGLWPKLDHRGSRWTSGFKHSDMRTERVAEIHALQLQHEADSGVAPGSCPDSMPASPAWGSGWGGGQRASLPSELGSWQHSHYCPVPYFILGCMHKLREAAALGTWQDKFCMLDCMGYTPFCNPPSVLAIRKKRKERKGLHGERLVQPVA